MDTTDVDIEFDENGVCSHCRRYDSLKDKYLLEKGKREKELAKIVSLIKKKGQKKKYDCIIGISGGVDSSYVAYLTKKLGLRPLAVHLDNGWNSELAVDNIENILKKLDIDLYTYVLDWEEFKDLQLSFLKASVPDGEIPTDHAIVATIFKIASQMGIKYIISGSNFATEAVYAKKWSQGHYDWRYIKNIQKKFGTKKLKYYPYFTFLSLFYLKIFKGQRTIRILNYIEYIKSDAKRILEKELGWKDYGGKHYESIYTRFYQGYILPKKFNYDKRKYHLSSLICSGQITREEALKEISKEPYPSEQLLKEDREFILKKLDITEDEFEKILMLPNKSILDYPSHETHFIFKFLVKSLKYLVNKFPFLKKFAF